MISKKKQCSWAYRLGLPLTIILCSGNICPSNTPSSDSIGPSNVSSLELEHETKSIVLIPVNHPSIVKAGDSVLLKINTENSEGEVKYTWAQKETGTEVNIENANAANLTFIAPMVPCGLRTKLSFTLEAKDEAGKSGKIETDLFVDNEWCTLTHDSNNNRFYPTKLALEGNGALWIGVDSGLKRFDGTTWTTLPWNFGPVAALAIDELNGVNIYAGAGTNVLKISPSTDSNSKYEWVRTSYQSKIKTIAANNGKIHVGHESGVTVWDGVQCNSRLKRNAVTAIAFSQESNVETGWYGTEFAKLWTDPGTKTNEVEWNKDLRIANAGIRSLMFSDDALYIGLSVGNLPYFPFWPTGGGVIQLDNAINNPSESGYKVFTTTDGLAGNDIRKIVVDGNKRVWVATSTGLSVKIGDTWKSFKAIDVNKLGGFPSDNLNDLAYDPVNNALWIAVKNRGITRIGLSVLEIN